MKKYIPTPTRIRVVTSSTQTDYWPEYKPFWWAGWKGFNVMWSKPCLTATFGKDLEIGSVEWAQATIDSYLIEQEADWNHKYNQTTTYIDYP